ncbi:MAG: O-antigen ligase family protein [Bacilli bacterium]|nr:O-antigen ligase family protein [Bacilli bacterium]
MKKNINKILTFINKHFLGTYVAANLFFVVLTSYFYCKQISSYYNNSRMYISFLILNIIFIIAHIITKVIRKEKIRFQIFDLFFVFIFAFSLLSAILSINTESAFFGFRGRYEGFFQIMYYFSLFFLASFLNKKDRKTIAFIIMICGLIEVIYAHCQVFKLFHVFVQYHRGKPWATGFVSNPNFFGTLCVLSLCIAISFFFDVKKTDLKVIYGILIVILMSGLLISNTLSALVGLIAALFYLIYYAIKNKKLKLFIITLILLSIITVVQTKIGKTNLLKDLIKTKNQSVEIAKGNVQDKYGSNRIYIWKNAIKIVPDNISYGVGIDNFYYAFGDRPLTLKGWFFDKAHNEYLQILVCEGIYALTAYLLFFGSIAYFGLKQSIKNKEVILLLPIIAYLVQAFFNISVIEVAPFFYAFLGLCVNRDYVE